MNEYDGELPESMKILSLKAKENDHTQDIDRDEEDDDEDPFALISKALTKIMKFKKSNGYKDYNRNRRKYLAHKEHKGKQLQSNKSKVMNFFECGGADHLVRDCPQKKNKQSSKWNRDKKEEGYGGFME